MLYDDGSYEMYDNTRNEEEQLDLDEEPPTGRTALVRGFGKLWSTRPQVRQGWATAQESGYTASIETVRESFGRYQCTDVYWQLPEDAGVHLRCSLLTYEMAPGRLL